MTNALLDGKKVHALISAVGANRDRLRQSIDGLRQLHDRWQDHNDTSINLIAQLAALKSNFDNMLDAMNYAINDMHPQLLSDLDVLMTSCALLVRHLDDLIERLRQSNHDAMDCAIKLRYTIGSRTMERLRKVAQRQTEAVTILVAACNCHAKAQRKILLHKGRHIKEEDVTSLKMLARSSKWNGGCIRALTQVSRTIQCSKYFLNSKILRNGSDYVLTGEDYESAAAMIRSEAIDRVLQGDATTLRRETKIVLMGATQSGKQLIMRQMKALYAGGYYTTSERTSYCQDVRSTIRLLVHAIIDLLKDTGINLSRDLNRDFAVLLHEVETEDVQHITPAAAEAIENIWMCSVFSTIYIRNSEIRFPQYASYFAQETSRIAENEYIPSEADIIRLDQSEGGIKELRFSWDELDVHLFNIGGHIPDQFRKRWFHQLEGTASLIYTVDVSLYDQPYLGSSTDSWLLSDFEIFEELVNWEKFKDSSVILVLNNFSRFCEKLQHTPLSVFFPDYTPNEADPDTSARQYILRRFKNVNQRGLSIYSFWVDLDMGDNQNLYAALKKTLLHIQQRKAKEEVMNAHTSRNRSDSTVLSSLLRRSEST
ncbi:guanine nucleotide-binding protein-like protein alpha-3 subunit [Dothidotthia symphoricarpi CBS 119687]|uniref:Guanine nucleotide-binding protein-like protein alpha-3 subunit n=1 Tax=Dothidotthia symphoricarpi CBS 119687 TaxID=1392245 RepID=A0A6A6AEK0_9PLEO|nr:guanine nucleotide-binding protein-like protein alpha-3 subunit [Dothidotthia symphoricarpi CBS 119687]KAF2130309.1 guanine nucleotide-binding protein-like protein alpha-3 subunit [Dothidotthia symphoricarpi CBS 119687]